MIKNISIIGAGNVASHLAKAFYQSSVTIDAIAGKGLKNAYILAGKYNSKAISNLEDLPPNSDLYLICVPDDAIEFVAESIVRVCGKEKRVAHTSGSTQAEILGKYFDQYAVLYPLQTFSKNRELDLSKVPFFLTSKDALFLSDLQNLIKPISANIHNISDKQRFVLHVAAVFSNNFTNYLFTISAQMLEKENLDFDFLRPLINETAKKVQDHHPKDMQTGPAIRGDDKTIKKHLAYLKDEKKWKRIYKKLSKYLVDRTEDGGRK